MLTLLSGYAAAAVLRHALVVGANDGGGALDPLRYAELDAERVSDVLVDLGGFEAPHVTVLYAPSVAELRASLKAHAAVSASFDEDLFMLYYSGHADARGLRLGTEIYPFEELKSELRSVPANVRIGVLDACRSGTITRLKGAALSEPFLMEERLMAEGEAWMTATSADESAQESDRLRGSFFTHYLLSGLRGAADTGDGDVSLDEAYAYASARVVEQTGGTAAGAQHPMYKYGLTGHGTLALTRVTEGRATVTLPPELAGDIAVIRMPDRTPVAEVAKKPGVSTTLALPPGTYKLRLTTPTRELRESMIGLSDGSRVVASRWGSVSAESGTAKGTGDPTFDALELARIGGAESLGWAQTALNAQDLRQSPLLAGSASLLVPGAGQFYNAQWVKGGLLFAGTFALLGGSLLTGDDGFFRGSVTGPDPLRLGAAMLYGYAVADAAWMTHKRESAPPAGGWTLASSAGWGPHGPGSPWAAGLNVEWLASRHVTFALDRVGWTRAPDESSAWSLGGRVGVPILAGPRLRPLAFAAVGARLRDAPGEAPTVVPVVGAGAQLRWYLTPRYFIEAEGRAETEGDEVVGLYGGGLGVHFGR